MGHCGWWGGQEGSGNHGAASKRRRGEMRIRAFIVQLAVCALAAACGVTTTVGRVASAPVHSPSTNITNRASLSTLPSASGRPAFDPSDVVDGRFVRSVTLDGGALVVGPPPPSAQPVTDQADARVLIRSDAQGPSPFGCAPEQPDSCVFGFGDVTISPALGKGLDKIPAWIGAAAHSTSGYNCPAETSTPPSAVVDAAKASPFLYQVAVLEGSGRTVLNYTSGASVCGFPATGPTLDSGSQSLSIPWELVSLSGQTITFRYHDYSCDPDPAVQSMRFGGNVKTETGSLGIYINAPYSVTYSELLGCAGPWITSSGTFGPETGSPDAPPPPEPTIVTHEPTGPVGATS